MKNFIVLLVICTQILFAQKKKINDDSRFSIGLLSGYTSFFGNNFLAKTYSNKPLVGIDSRMVLKNNFGLGGQIKFNSSNVNTTEFVGNSVVARFREFGLYGCYNYFLDDKFAQTTKAGFNNFQLKNTLEQTKGIDYYTNGTSYFVASEFHYFLDDGISVMCTLEYSYIDLEDIQASKSLGTNYQAANRIGIELGIRFWF